MAKRKSREPKNIAITVIVLVFAAIIFTILVIFFLTSSKKGSPLLFEEAYDTSKLLIRDIYIIDKAVSDVLYQAGVTQDQIIFLSVVPRQKEGYSWDFSKIEARIPHECSVPQTAEGIADRLFTLGLPVRVSFDRRPGGELICNIFYKEFHTHQIIILSDIHLPANQVSVPKVGIIIDDLGYERSLAHEFAKFSLPLTLSILPFAPSTEEISLRAHDKSKEIMLHLPMEPIGYPDINPGEGVLLLSMEKKVLLETLCKDLNQVLLAAGVNNHMGSRFTENEEKTKTVLQELKKRNLYFIDSRTCAESVAHNVAREIGMPTAERDIFLDNDLAEEALKTQMERLLRLAKHRGSAIGIGHPHKETLMLLEKYKIILSKEVEVVPVSRLLTY